MVHDARPDQDCIWREVRIYGQRLEAGIDPKTKDIVPEVTQNDWADANDKRFVVAKVCLRPLSNEENVELFEWGSKH